MDLHALGWDKCTRAMEQTLQSEKALPLFDQVLEAARTVLLSVKRVALFYPYSFDARLDVHHVHHVI